MTLDTTDPNYIGGYSMNPPEAHPSILIVSPPPKGRFSFTPDFYLSFYVGIYPNAFIRFMQRWLLGIYWRRA